jgi:hypothetical protein
VGLIVALSALAAVCVALMIYGEWSSRYLLSAGALGALLVLYSFIVLLFRKAQITTGE